MQHTRDELFFGIPDLSMNKLFLSIFFSLLSLTAFGNADHLRNLDRVLAKDYITRKQSKIDSLKLIEKGSANKWRDNYSLANAYSDFNMDSALFYSSKAASAALTEKESQKSALQLAGLYNSSLMMYKEALEIFNEINPDIADKSTRRDYFILGVQIFRNLELNAADKSLGEKYANIKRAFRDSVLRISPNEKFIYANELLESGKPNEVIRLFEEELTKKDYNPANGAMYHLIANVYHHLNDKEKEELYLTLAARTDIENGVREYKALPQLALLLYEKGDINRAYRYMQRSLEDAKSSNARVRLFDMTDTLSVISDTYSSQLKSSRRNLMILLIAACILLVIAGISLYYARQRNRLLQEARCELEKSNEKLKQTSDIKEKYVRRFMNLSREYLEILDNYRARLFKIGANRNFDSLFSAIKSSEVIENTTSTFYENFDKAFLDIYPDFLDEFNQLLLPDERIRQKQEGRLNTELRIFALMKLGIIESAEIAKFLHCSQSTVYNYRTRFRGKALDKAAFDSHFFNQKPN